MKPKTVSANSGINVIRNIQPSVFPIEYFQQTLETQIIGKSTIEYYADVSSTNDIAIERGKMDGAEEGTIVIADYQSAGRGRYGRTWEAKSGKCILASIVFMYRLKKEQVHLPNLIGALSIVQGIDNHTGLAAKIKHPNDVRIEKKKVAGVLTELQYDKHNHPFFVLGFGVNVNNTIEELPTLRETATSLRIANGYDNNEEISRVELLHVILGYLETNYLHLKSGNTQIIDEQISLWEESE